MSVRIKFVIGDKAVSGMMFWVMIGLALVIIGAILFTLISYKLGVQLYLIDWIEDWLCKLTNGAWCNDDSRVKLSVESLASGINYICSDGAEKADSNFVACDGTGSDAKCNVYFYLPQATVGMENWIGGTGDPKYLVYHEAFPPGEDIAWSPMQAVSTALIVIPAIKPIGGALLGGIKQGVFVFGPQEAMKTVAEGLSSGGVQTTLDQFIGTQAPEVVTMGLKEKLSSAALNDKMIEGIQKGSLTVSKTVLASEVGKGAQYATSIMQKFIPCESNSLCVKSAFTVNSQYVAPKTFPLSATCKDAYIELSKRLDVGTKFYLASPCYARLDITKGKCNCVPQKAELGGKEIITCSDYAILPTYESDCIKISPHAIDTGKENFCYTPPKVFDVIAGTLATARYFCPASGPAMPICWAGTTIGAYYFERLTQWPHGFLEAE